MPCTWEASPTSSNTSPFRKVATPKYLRELERIEGTLIASRSTQKFRWSNVNVESALGEGGFSIVLKVSVASKGVSNENFDCPSAATSGRSYALKCLKAKSMTSSKAFLVAAGDLAVEADTLSRLRHENIVRVHGISCDSPSQSYTTQSGGDGLGYFVLLDLLSETLLDRLYQWRALNNRHDHKQPRQKNFILSGPSASAATRKHDMINRTDQIVQPMISAMRYLHEQGIVLRDLKPENIGFDSEGTLKLFDFGFARPIGTCYQNDIAGTVSYMAPEIMLGEGTFLKSDVYSFGIVLWEVCTMLVPFQRKGRFYKGTSGDHSGKSLSRDEIVQHVAYCHGRPTPLSHLLVPSKTLRELIRSCWSPDPMDRPSFARIQETWSSIATSKKALPGACASKYSSMTTKKPWSRDTVAFKNLEDSLIISTNKRPDRWMSILPPHRCRLSARTAYTASADSSLSSVDFSLVGSK